MKECRGQITLVGIESPYVYYLDVNPTVIKVSTNGTISEGQDTITCVAKQNNGALTIQLGSDTVTIGYNTSADSNIRIYPESGVKVDASWDSVTFYLYLFTNASLSDNYYTSVTVPIIKDGLVDANFDVWRGEDEFPLPNEQEPYVWAAPASKWKRSGELEQHLGDYYISTSGRYYKFVKKNDDYIWTPVTDKILEDWLSRADENTQCFIIPDDRTLKQYFTEDHPEIKYKIGDLAVTREDALRDNNIIFSYDQQWFCKRSRLNNEFLDDDWTTSDEVRKKLKEVGIDLDEYTVTITADEVVFENTAGLQVSLMDMYDGNLKIKSNHIQLDSDVTVNGSFTSMIAEDLPDSTNLLKNSSFNYDISGWSLI